MEMNEYHPPGLGSEQRLVEEFAYSGAEMDGESPTALLLHYVHVLLRHAWKIVGFVLAVVSATLLYSLQLTPLYEATALLELESLNQMTRFGSEFVSYNLRNESKVIETQLRLINSPDVVEAVSRDLGLGRSPVFGYPGKGEPVVPTSLPGLTANMVPGTYLLAIKYRSASPELCRDIANSVAKAYLEKGYENRYENSRQLQDWLDLQLEELEARSERAQQRLLAYEREHNIAGPAGRTDLVAEELQGLQGELIATRAERMRKEAAYRSVEAGELEDLLISSQGSPIATLVQQREALEAELVELSTQYGPNHPRYKRHQARIDQLDGMLERGRERVLERMAAEYREVVQRENAIRESYLEKKKQVDRFSELAVDYGSLKREANATTALYEQLLATVNEVGLHSSMGDTLVRFAEPAKLPGDSVYPDIPQYLLWAFLASTALAMGAVLLIDYLDRTVRDTAQVEQWLRIPVLANLPRMSGNKRPAAYLLPGPSANLSKRGTNESYALLEGFSMLRTSLMLSSQVPDWRLLLISSAVPSEGKSTVSMGLAVAMAQQAAGQKVLLVDADLRRPTVHTVLGIQNQAGLSSVLENRAALDDVVQDVPGLPALSVLPRGPSTRQPNELLATNMGRLMDELREKFNYVILDSAPLLASADSMILATMVDGVVLVARAGDTSRDMVGAGFRQIKRVRASILGLVLNQVKQGDRYGYQPYYYSYYRNEEADT
jgi:capsular exopolysaccharide synthesis family protein